jgi:hypothetical protein
VKRLRTFRELVDALGAAAAEAPNAETAVDTVQLSSPANVAQVTTELKRLANGV